MISKLKQKLQVLKARIVNTFEGVKHLVKNGQVFLNAETYFIQITFSRPQFNTKFIGSGKKIDLDLATPSIFKIWVNKYYKEYACVVFGLGVVIQWQDKWALQEQMSLAKIAEQFEINPASKTPKAIKDYYDRLKILMGEK